MSRKGRKINSKASTLPKVETTISKDGKLATVSMVADGKKFVLDNIPNVEGDIIMALRKIRGMK